MSESVHGGTFDFRSCARGSMLTGWQVERQVRRGEAASANGVTWAGSQSGDNVTPTAGEWTRHGYFTGGEDIQLCFSGCRVKSSIYQHHR